MMTPDSLRLVVEAVVVILGFVALVAAASYHVIQSRRAMPDAIKQLVASNSEILASNAELSRRVRSLEQDRTRDHATLLSLHTRLEMQTTYSRELAAYSRYQAAYSATLADKLRELGQDVPPAPGNPPTPPAELLAPLPPIEVPPLAESLPVILAALFNNEELDDLALRVGARPEDLIGSTVTRRAHSLALWARRHSKLDRLVAVARSLRPEGEI